MQQKNYQRNTKFIMENNNNIEGVYELIEQYNFAELSESDRLLVLSVMTESQYSNMRKTVDDLKLDFGNDIEPVINIPIIGKTNSDSRIRQILNYRIKFYQVAASIAIIISAFFMLQHSNRNNTEQMIAKGDTVIIHQIDSVYTIVYDTVEIIKENVEYLQTDFSRQKENNLIAYSNSKTDCSNSLCPNEMEDIIAMNSRNTIKNDSTTKGLLLSLN